MEKNLVSGTILTLMLISTLALAFNIETIKAEPTIWTVDDDGTADFWTIQEAINNTQVASGDTIFVYNGTYYEDIVVNKAVSLIGESKDAMICGSISVETDNVTIQSFTIQGEYFQIGRWSQSRLFKNIAIIDNIIYRSIEMINTVNATMRENKLINGGILIDAFPFSFPTLGNNTIAGNSITNASIGILVRFSNGNEIIGNTLIGNDVGILLESSNTTVLDNHVEVGGIGIHVSSFNNTLSRNAMTGNIYNFGFGLLLAHPNYIDTSNTVNGMPIYYLVDQGNLIVDPETYSAIGFLALINCVNITVNDLTFAHNGQGILLEGGSGNSVMNCNVVENVVGIWSWAPIDAQDTRHRFVGNIVSDNGLGMWLLGSSLNNINNNTFENNTRTNVPDQIRLHYGDLRQGFGWASGALSLLASASNMIIGNTMIDSDEGIYLGLFSSNNTLRNNSMTGNLHNFGVEHHARGVSSYVHDIDQSNIINGKPIIYWVNQHNRQVTKNAGYVAIVNSTNIVIKDLSLSENRQGVLIVSSNDSVISNNKISSTACGIVIRGSSELFPGPIYHSTNDLVYDNTITACGTAICLYSGEGHTVSSNYISGNIAGIHTEFPSSGTVILANTITNCTYWGHEKIPHDAWLWDVGIYGPAGIDIESPNNIIMGNTISYNEIGMTIGLLTMVGGNVIYHNNFINNIYRQVMIGSMNLWDNGYPSGGNYWTDYTGVDLYGGPYQNETGSDGIGDTPYMLSECIDPDVPPEWKDQRDKYPLMKPWMPSGTFADLVKRKAWPEHHHYDVSKDRDGYQTFYAKVRNTGNQLVWVKVVFNVTMDDGSSTIVESEPFLIEQEEIVELLANFGPLAGEDVGKYNVSATCWYSLDKIVWAQGEKRKTFKFTIVP